MYICVYMCMYWVYISDNLYYFIMPNFKLVAAETSGGCKHLRNNVYNCSSGEELLLTPLWGRVDRSKAQVTWPREHWPSLATGRKNLSAVEVTSLLWGHMQPFVLYSCNRKWVPSFLDVLPATWISCLSTFPSLRQKSPSWHPVS